MNGVNTMAKAKTEETQQEVATALIEVPLVPETNSSVESIFVTLMPRHKRFFKRFRQSLHVSGATYESGNGTLRHVDTNAGVIHWILDQFTKAD